MLSLGLFLGAGSVRRFTPARLFANGEQGGWWDPSDFSTQFQDSAGTTPVTAVGQPVGKVLDKSGRGNHRTQGTTSSRPTLRQDASGYFYWQYDGVDDSMSAAVDLSGTSKLTIVWGGYKASDSLLCIPLEVGTSGSGVSATLLGPRNPGSGNFGSSLTSVTGSDATAGVALAAPILVLATGLFDTTAGTAAGQEVLRLNGAQAAVGNALVTSAPFPNGSISFGQRAAGTFRFSGREYQTIVRGAASSAAQISQAEHFVAGKMGLPI